MSCTKEIWKPEESGMYILACDPDGKGCYVAVEIRGWGRLSKLGEEEAERVQRDRARRIAALWNAAEYIGSTTKEIEDGVIQFSFELGERHAEVINAAKERIERLEAEKAEMLEVLERIRDKSGPFNLGEMRKLVEAAIRKARDE